MSVGRTASGTMPTCASSARRRGLALAKTSLAEAVIDPTLGQIVRRHLDHHLVAGENADAVLAHLTRGMGDDDMAIGDQLDPEIRVGQQFLDNALEFQLFFLGHSSSWDSVVGRRYVQQSCENQGFEGSEPQLSAPQKRSRGGQ